MYYAYLWEEKNPTIRKIQNFKNKATPQKQQTKNPIMSEFYNLLKALFR